MCGSASALAVFAALALWEVLAPRACLRLSAARARWPSQSRHRGASTPLLVRLLIPIGGGRRRGDRGAARLGPAQHHAAWPPGAGGLVSASWRSISRSTPSMSSSIKCRCCGGCTGCITPISTSTSPPALRFHPIEILLSIADQDRRRGAGAAMPAVAVIVLRGGAQRRPRCSIIRNVAMPAWLDSDRDACWSVTPRHAPRASFDAAARDRQQFRFQSAVVGPAVPAPTGVGAGGGP